MTMGLCRGGKFQLMRPGVVSHWCPGCGEAHVLDLSVLDNDGRSVGWNGSFEQPSFGGVVRHETDKGSCTYELRGGELHFCDDCWHPLAGKVSPLEEFPT